MKKIITLVILLTAFSSHISAQQISGSYEFNQSLDIGASEQVRVGIKDEKSRDIKIEISSGDRITVIRVDETEGLVYFKYWFHDTSNADEYKLYNNGVFTLPLSQFKQVTVPLYHWYKGATVGAYTVPFRLRGIGIKGDPFDFESSLSLQANLVFGLGSIYSQTSWLDVSLGIGLTGVNLDAQNSTVTSARTASALTLSFGALFKPSDFANIGLFLGWDTLGANDREVNWLYNGGTWLGLGININFNEISTTKSAKPK